MSATIKINSEPGNIDFVVSTFRELVHDTSLSRYNPKGNSSDICPVVHFKLAEIKQNSSNASSSKYNGKKAYPLRIYSTNGFVIMISEVCTGGGPTSKKAEAMIEILKIAGFKLRDEVIDAIYNKDNVNITIWNEDAMKQF